jgi:hypothetical protein
MVSQWVGKMASLLVVWTVVVAADVMGVDMAAELVLWTEMLKGDMLAEKKVVC